MRPGAAVRLKGTWVDESRKQSDIEEISQASSEDETSTGSEQPELKVSEVEVLGGSDPMVRYQKHLDITDQAYSYTYLDLPDPEQISDP